MGFPLANDENAAVKFFRSKIFGGKVVRAFVQQTTVKEFLKLVHIYAFCNDFGAPPQLMHAAIYAIHAALMRMALHALYRTAVMIHNIILYISYYMKLIRMSVQSF